MSLTRTHHHRLRLTAYGLPLTASASAYASTYGLRLQLTPPLNLIRRGSTFLTRLFQVASHHTATHVITATVYACTPPRVRTHVDYVCRQSRRSAPLCLLIRRAGGEKERTSGVYVEMEMEMEEPASSNVLCTFLLLL